MSISDPRDRSQEFFSTVASLKKQMQKPLSQANGRTLMTNGTGLDAVPSQLSMPAPTNRAFPQQSQFTQAAKHISQGIIHITEKLEHLAKFASKRSLFNDPMQEINQLTFVIKRDLTTLNSEIDLLQNFVTQNRQQEAMGTKDNAQNSDEIVNSLKRELATATHSFTDILRTRQQNLKDGSKRRKEFEGTSNKLKKSAALTSRLSLDEPEFNESKVNTEDTDQKDGGSLLQSSQQVQIVVDNVQEDTYYQSRAEALGEIEKTIVELAEMYKRLATIVAMHEDTTRRIDENMTKTMEYMDLGQTQLQQALQSTSSGTWLIIKAFVILMLFSIFWVVVR
jgi:syntaxin 5